MDLTDQLNEIIQYCRSLKDIQCTRNEARLIVGATLKKKGLSRRLSETVCTVVYGKEEDYNAD